MPEDLSERVCVTGGNDPGIASRLSHGEWIASYSVGIETFSNVLPALDQIARWAYPYRPVLG